MSEAPQQTEPAFTCIYGKSGAGKTTDCLFSFPRALFIAPPGALKPALTVAGYVPRQTKQEAPHIMAVTELLPKISKKDFDAAVVDDLSLLIERTVAFYSAKLKGWDLWGEVRKQLLNFRDAGRRCGLHLIVNAHEKEPEVKDGKPVRGGPSLPGKMPNEFPPATDLFVRAVPMPKAGAISTGDVPQYALDRPGWPVAYRCQVQEADWSTKDRHGVTPDWAPMNVGEILRMAGYNIRRLEGLEWQENAVAQIALLLIPIMEQTATSPAGTLKGAMAPVLTPAVERMKAKGVNPLHIQWTLRDAVDRASLTYSRKNMLQPFGVALTI